MHRVQSRQLSALLLLSATSLSLVSATNRVESSEGLVIFVPAMETIIAPMPIEVAAGWMRRGKLVRGGDITLEASSGAIQTVLTPASDFLHRAIFHPPEQAYEEGATVELVARSGDIRASTALMLEPRAVGRVEVDVHPETWTKGDEGEITVTLRAFSASGELRAGPPPLLAVNTGSLTELSAGSSPGEWISRYVPATTRYPEVAVFAALLPWPHSGSPNVAFGHTTLPLSAAIDLPGAVRPRVEVTVEVADKIFGPVTSDRSGSFQVPVMVPPGHGDATGISVDRFGNRRETLIDLRLPPTNRVTGVLQPSTLVADGVSLARVVVLAVDAHGNPSPESTLRMTASLGSVGELRREGEGVFLGWYRPPERIESSKDKDIVTVTIDGDPSSVALLPMSLLPGPPARLEQIIEPEVVQAPSEKSARVILRLFDEQGSLIERARVEATAERGRLRPAIRGGADHDSIGRGLIEMEYDPPSDAAGWADRVDITASSLPGRGAIGIVLDSGASDLKVVDAVGRPVPGAMVTIGDTQVRADEAGSLGGPTSPVQDLEVYLSEGGQASRLILLEDEEGALHGVPGRPLSLGAELTIPLMEPIPVSVEGHLDGLDEPRQVAVVWQVFGGAGERVVSVSVGTEEVSRSSAREGVVVVTADPGDPIMIVDVESGVSALLFVPH